jgi:hypothetical protein
MTTYFSFNRGPRLARRVFTVPLTTLLLGLLAGGCGEPSLEEANASPQPGDSAAALGPGHAVSRALTGANGMGTNGMGTNGMGTNGLSTSGLIINAMNQSAFITWFNQDPALADTVMRYVVACGVSDGSSRVWTNPTTGIRYIWNGAFGLTPGWASGQPANETEQQLITACMAAHTNKYGLQVPISVLGRDAQGTPIPVGLLEFATFAQREACFFGNIFQGEGVYAGSDALLANAISSVRACGLETPGTGDKCLPIRHVQPCSQICTPDLQNSAYASCTYNGKSYRAITTRIRILDLNICGDGVCQISESCGTGLTPDSCMDCGPCP